MEILNILGGIASVASLIISIIAYRKAASISNEVHVVGKKNTTAGRDINVR